MNAQPFAPEYSIGDTADCSLCGSRIHVAGNGDWVHSHDLETECTGLEAEPSDLLDGEPTLEQYAEFGRHVAAGLGAVTEWGDELEWIGEAATQHLGQSIGESADESLEQWRRVAAALDLGLDYGDE